MSTSENGSALAIIFVSPLVVQSPSVQQIIEIDLHIRYGQASIWSQLNENGKIIARLMIQTPLQGNWIVITLEFGSNNILIQFPNLMEVAPLLVLISLQEHIPLTDRQHK